MEETVPKTKLDTLTDTNGNGDHIQTLPHKKQGALDLCIRPKNTLAVPALGNRFSAMLEHSGSKLDIATCAKQTLLTRTRLRCTIWGRVLVRARSSGLVWLFVLVSFISYKHVTSNSVESSPASVMSKPSINTNTPGDYIWLQEILWTVVRNEAHALGVADTATGKPFTPIFFVLGSCPSTYCSMQAVMYSVSKDLDIDFWWVKPQKLEVARLEPNTLSHNTIGPYKNDPGRSKHLYKTFADMFSQRFGGQSGMYFGIERITNKAGQFTFRAYLEQKQHGSKMYLYMVWQEDWTSNPFSTNPYIKGKIVYQKNLKAFEFFSRQYCLQNGSIFISEVEERPFKTILPSKEIKELRHSVY